jgi:hypothetical protein
VLQAILNRKLGRSIDSQEVHWSALFKASEDSLTSTVFGTLLYLPTDLFWHTLKNACYGDHLADIDENIISIEFWPHWSGKDTTNVNYVEPDVFIRTKEVDVIIEAKRYDDGQQLKGQWENELNSYLTEYGSENRKVILIALGGLHSSLMEPITSKSGAKCDVVKCHWLGILHQIKFLRKERTRQASIGHDSVVSVCNDLVSAFAIHGYFTGDWFETGGFERNLHISEKSIDAFNLLGTNFKFMYQPKGLAPLQISNNSITQLALWNP